MKPTGWRYALGSSVHGRMSSAARVASFASRIESAAERLQGVTLESRDALDVIRHYGQRADVCIYADPPYLGSTRATNYGREMTRDEQHVEMADALHSVKASVVLSGYASSLYEELFADWHRVEMRGATTQAGHTDRVEVLWSNRLIGEPSLFDAFEKASTFSLRATEPTP